MTGGPMYEKRIEIRWRDMDAFGHVNNAIYLTYLEETRDEWMETFLGKVSDLADFVLARVAIDYRSELTQGDDLVIGRVGVAAIGTSSFRTREELRKADGTLAAEAVAVVVGRDRSTGRSRPLTHAERGVLEEQIEAG